VSFKGPECLHSMFMSFKGQECLHSMFMSFKGQECLHSSSCLLKAKNACTLCMCLLKAKNTCKLCSCLFKAKNACTPCVHFPDLDTAIYAYIFQTTGMPASGAVNPSIPQATVQPKGIPFSRTADHATRASVKM